MFQSPSFIGRIAACVIFIVFAPELARAEARFEAPLLLHPGRGPLAQHSPQRWHLAIGDLDLDGRVDVVAPMYDSLAIYLGRGDGTLQRPRLVPIPARTERPVIADFDGDGAPDIAYGGPHRVEVLFGDGTASHWSRVAFATPDEACTVVAGDFDGDGIADLASVGYDLSYTRWIRTYLARPGRTFVSTSETQPNAWPYPLALRATDVDSDGRGDLITAHPYESMRVWHSDGDGTFTLRSTIGAAAWGFDLGDVNGDAHVDLVIAGGTAVRVLAGRGGGTFDEPVTLPYSGSAIDVALGDLDGDGDLDIAYPPPSSSPSTSALFTKLGTGDGDFESNRTLPIGHAWNPIALADLDGDHRLDFLGIAWDALVTALGDGAGGFRRAPVPEPGPSFRWAITADLDADGDDDVVGISGSGSSAKLNVGLGDPSRHVFWSVPIDVPDASTIFSADFDGDGGLDVAAALSGTWIAWLRGRRDGGLDTPVVLPSPGVGYDVQATGDVDGDGAADLVYRTPSSLRVALGAGPVPFGRFVDSSLPATGTAFRLIALGDLNGDGLLDAAVTDRASNGSTSDATLHIALGNGTGTFVPTLFARYPQVGSGWRALVGDVNGDGRDDLVTFDPRCTICAMKGTVAVHLQRPDGTLSARVESPGPEVLHELRDVNGDGRADLVGFWSAGLAILDGNADGSFATPQGYDGGTGIAAIGDLDADGRMDLVSVPSTNGGVTMLPIHFGRESTPPIVVSLAPAGATVAIGATHTIQWVTTDDVAPGGVDLLLSRRGRRGPFERIADDLPATGSHAWSVTGPPSDSVALAIVARDEADNIATTIAEPLGRIVEAVADIANRSNPPPLALSMAGANPARDRIRVGITLPAAGTARISLHDLEGRRVATLWNGHRPGGPGFIEASLPALEPGLYYLRLESSGQSASARVTLLR